jgi:hypothetical protein
MLSALVFIMKIALLILSFFVNTAFACGDNSNASIRVLGSVVNSNSEHSAVLIKLTGSDAAWYLEGDLLPSGYKILKIHKRYIVAKYRINVIKVMLDNCGQFSAIDNPHLYLAELNNYALNGAEQNEDGASNLELEIGQTRTFLAPPAIDVEFEPASRQEDNAVSELTGGQARVFYENLALENNFENQAEDEDVGRSRKNNME